MRKCLYAAVHRKCLRVDQVFPCQRARSTQRVPEDPLVGAEAAPVSKPIPPARAFLDEHVTFVLRDEIITRDLDLLLVDTPGNLGGRVLPRGLLVDMQVRPVLLKNISNNSFELVAVKIFVQYSRFRREPAAVAVGPFLSPY